MNIETPIKNLDTNAAAQVELEEKNKEAIELEFESAKEQFRELIELVNGRYEALPEKVQEDFVKHNEEILKNVVELGLARQLPRETLKEAELAAVLHDIAKADASPEEFREIPNYILATHGERGAIEASRILSNDFLRAHGFLGDPEKVRERIANAIRQHMGPHPGFMANILRSVNQELNKRNLSPIAHPEARGFVSETLLAADMGSLAGARGRQKILSLREASDFFQKEDRKTIEQYAKFKIELSQGEAAMLSALESAFQARDMIENPDFRAWIISLISKSMDESFSFAGESINPRVVLMKKEVFDKANQGE
jgi:hypothetical protein